MSIKDSTGHIVADPSRTSHYDPPEFDGDIRDELLAAIRKERERQISLAHGGDTLLFDKSNSMNDWVAYICAYAGRASVKVPRNQKEDAAMGLNRDDSTRFRDNMVKVAALALAALESYKNGNFSTESIPPWE